MAEKQKCCMTWGNKWLSRAGSTYERLEAVKQISILLDFRNPWDFINAPMTVEARCPAILRNESIENLEGFVFLLGKSLFSGWAAVGRCKYRGRYNKCSDARSLFQVPASIRWHCRLVSLWPPRQAEFPLLTYAPSQGMQQLTLSFTAWKMQHFTIAEASWENTQSNGLGALTDLGPWGEWDWAWCRMTLVHEEAASPPWQAVNWWWSYQSKKFCLQDTGKDLSPKYKNLKTSLRIYWCHSMTMLIFYFRRLKTAKLLFLPLSQIHLLLIISLSTCSFFLCQHSNKQHFLTSLQPLTHLIKDSCIGSASPLVMAWLFGTKFDKVHILVSKWANSLHS